MIAIAYLSWMSGIAIKAFNLSHIHEFKPITAKFKKEFNTKFKKNNELNLYLSSLIQNKHNVSIGLV